MLTDEAKSKLIAINEKIKSTVDELSEVCKNITCKDCPYGCNTGMSFFCLKQTLNAAYKDGCKKLK